MHRSSTGHLTLKTAIYGKKSLSQSVGEIRISCNFSRKIVFPVAEINSRFIDIHPCLDNILNVFHNKKYNVFNKHIINATTTAINTCEKCI